LVYIHRTDVNTFATAGAFVFVHSYLPHQELRLFVFNKIPKNSSLKLLYLFNRDSVKFADLHAAFTTQALVGIHRIGLAINHLEHIHWANVHTFLVAIALVLINCYFPHLLVTSSRVELSYLFIATKLPTYRHLCELASDQLSTLNIYVLCFFGAEKVGAAPSLRLF